MPIKMDPVLLSLQGVFMKVVFGSILTVSQLNRQVKGYLENELGIVHVEGEMSNLSKPSSGHFYFTMKDTTAQVRCVFFKNRHQGALTAKLQDGQHIVASGRLSLYEARGDYQLIVEQVTEAGLGDLYQRFEALKIKLAAEGLFNPARKRPLPSMPNVIGLITSTSGAAIRDVLSTLARRYPIARILIYPSEVQGATAAQQLIKALTRANKDKRCDVLILARGGGSLEDLWAFNDEQLAREIATSAIPIVSGVGHETDFTIADFVADYRAETPTAAAAAVSPDVLDLSNGLHQTLSRLQTAISRITQSARLTLCHLTDKIASPEKTIAVYWQRLDYLERQIQSSLLKTLAQKKHQTSLSLTQLKAHNPSLQIKQQQQQLKQLLSELITLIRNKTQHLKQQLSSNSSTLNAVSPLATLERGYAIATRDNKVIYQAKQTKPGEVIEVRLSKGSLTCEVIKTQASG